MSSPRAKRLKAPNTQQLQQGQQQQQQQQSASSIPGIHPIWYSVSSILSSSLDVPIVYYFLDDVKANSQKELKFVDSPKLVVYKNKESFDNRNNGVLPLTVSSLVDGLGMSENEPIIVVVPTQRKIVDTFLYLHIKLITLFTMIQVQ